MRGGMFETHKKIPLLLAILLMGLATPHLMAQNEEPTTDTTTVDEPIKGGVTYEPLRDDEGRLRDPFRSPFELEREERERQAAQRDAIPDMESRLPINISELTLKGIYLQAKTGYWAIFTVGGEYDWYQVGTKFRDGDLVNITDGAVVFKHYVSDDATQVREVIKELHRGEE